MSILIELAYPAMDFPALDKSSSALGVAGFPPVSS